MCHISFCVGLVLPGAWSCEGNIAGDSSHEVCSAPAPQEAFDRINSAVQEADKTCIVDADCIEFELVAGYCMFGCGGEAWVSAKGAAEIQSAIDLVDSTFCSSSEWQ